MMNKEYTVGQYLVDRLYELGLGHLFSIAGDYSIEWITKYVEPSKIQVIEEVNELNAGYAADGYARLKGIGALCVTYSVGAFSAVNAIAGADVEWVPVVLINGTPSIKKTLQLEQTGFTSHHFIGGSATNLKVFEPITVATVRIDRSQEAPMEIDYALTKCITERRPVYIELLQDIVDQPCESPKEKLKPAKLISDKDSLKQSIDLVKAKLESAKNPLLWLGVEIDRFGLHAQAEEIIRQLKIPFVTELVSKAVLSENDAQFAGVFDGLASSVATQALVRDSDFVLALGVWLTDINDLGRQTNLDKTAFVALDTVKLGTYFSAQVSLEHLLDGLINAKVTCKIQQLPIKPGSPKFSEKLTDKITYQGFYDYIAQHITDNTIIGSDPSLNYFGSLLLKVGAPRGYIVQSSYSSIGYIGPAATGICLAKKDDQRVMVFSGDGGFQMTAQCLSTQTRFGLNPIIFVIDNGVYGVEQWLGDASVFHTENKFYNSCILRRWNYSKLSEVFDCKGWNVSTYSELKDAISGALKNSNSPSIIQVVVPEKSIPANASWKKN